MVPDRALVCCHVAEGAAAILCASRDEPAPPGGPEWRFLCGAFPHGQGDLREWELPTVVRRDPAALEIVMRPRGTELVRAEAGARWHTQRGPVLLPRRRSHRWPELEPRFPPRPGEPLDAGDLELIAEVAQVGWHVVVRPAEGDAPAYAHTVGLFRSFDHPEVLLSGLAPDALRAALYRIGALVRGGALEDPARTHDVLEGRRLELRRIAPRHYAAWLGTAVWYHGGSRFPALQCVWSDPDGRFPWDPWFPRELRDRQPVLFEPERA